MKEYFPLVIATGKAFCNRVEEREYLKNNIQAHKHTLLLAPRRYGKTSLVYKVIDELNIPAVAIDFFAITDQQSVLNMIFSGVGELLGSLLPKHKNILQKIHSIFSHLNPTVELSLAGQKIKFQVDTKKSSPEDIMFLLKGLDKLAEEEGKRAVLILDEFQQLRTVKDSIALEGAIRHAVERSKNICYLFSGSTRNLLQKMFDDSERPLYRSCDKLALARISAKDYCYFLMKAAKEQWNKELSEEVIGKILAITRHHPYYTNALCAKLWQFNKPPSVERVEQTWAQLVQIEKAWVVQIIMGLSANQRVVMVELAKEPSLEPTGKEFLSRARLSSASANQALKSLLDKDLIYINENNKFAVLDPVIEFCLQSYN